MIAAIETIPAQPDRLFAQYLIIETLTFHVNGRAHARIGDVQLTPGSVIERTPDEQPINS
jgi:hypothetical protein